MSTMREMFGLARLEPETTEDKMEIDGLQTIAYELNRKGASVGEEFCLRVQFTQDINEPFVLSLKHNNKVSCIKLTKPEVLFIYRAMRTMENQNLFD